MPFSPRNRNVALTAHLAFSLGWFGAVASYLAVALAGLLSHSSEALRASVLGMDLVGWTAITPFAAGSLLTGLVSSYGTSWGLFRHYWIVIKLMLTVGSTVLLLAHMQPADELADLVRRGGEIGGQARAMQAQLAGDAAAAALVLLIATVLSVFKPRGATPFARSPKRPEPA